MPDHPLKLIVGLGNPGPQHDSNRHNAGVIFLNQLCKHYGGQLRGEAKFFGEFTTINIDGSDIKLLFPTTFMNRSGKSVAAVGFPACLPSLQMPIYRERKLTKQPSTSVSLYQFQSNHKSLQL